MCKKGIIIFLALLIVFALPGCAPSSDRAVSCDEVVRAYEAEGYEVFHKSSENGDHDWNCYVKATDQKTGDYIYFHFFETQEQAESYADTRQYNGLLWVFSVIYGDPSWLTTKTHQNIEIEYDQSDLYEPFAALLRAPAQTG